MEETTLMRVLRAIAGTGHKSWFGFGKGAGKTVLEPAPDWAREAVVRLGADGRPEELAPEWGGPAKKEDLFFAVRRLPFEAELEVPLEKDANGHRWLLKFLGRTEIRDFGRFAAHFRGHGGNLGVEDFLRDLGTRPQTELVHAVSKYFGTMALDEKDTNGAYADVTRLAQYRFMTEEAFSGLFGKLFAEQFGGTGVVSWKVTAWKVASPDRDAAAEEEERLEKLRRQQALELAELQHQAEVANRQQDVARKEAAANALKACSEGLFSKGKPAAMLTALVNLDLAADAAPDLKAALETMGTAMASERLLALAGDGRRNDRVPSNKVLEVGGTRTRSVGPVRTRMKEGGCYHLEMTFPRDGYLTLLDIGENGDVVPMLPILESEGTSTRVRAGQRVEFGTKASPWYKDSFEQYDNGGVDNFVAIVADEPVLLEEETTEFGESLPAETVGKVLWRLEKKSPGTWASWVLQVRIEPGR